MTYMTVLKYLTLDFQATHVQEKLTAKSLVDGRRQLPARLQNFLETDAVKPQWSKLQTVADQCQDLSSTKEAFLKAASILKSANTFGQLAKKNGDVC